VRQGKPAVTEDEHTHIYTAPKLITSGVIPQPSTCFHGVVLQKQQGIFNVLLFCTMTNKCTIIKQIIIL
jgi:hypothetical protein